MDGVPISSIAFLPMKSALSISDKHSQTGLLGSDLVVHLMSVQRHSGFQTAGCLCTQSAWDQTVFFAGFQQSVPQLNSILGCAVQLYAVFTGVAGTGYQAFTSGNLHFTGEGVVFNRQLFAVT